MPHPVPRPYRTHDEFSIESLSTRRVFDSHVLPTTEFRVRLADGRTGSAAPSHGETVGIYEEQPDEATDAGSSRGTSLRALQDAARGVSLTQRAWDELLGEHLGPLGRNACSALSEAAFRASGAMDAETPAAMPRLCSNILNGGHHAYTNPVLSDFQEYVLVARSDDIDDVIAQHNEIQAVVRERLSRSGTCVVSGNPVHRFASADNRACIEFLLSVRDDLGLRDAFDLYIDASAGDLRSEGDYVLSLTDGVGRSSEEMVEYWRGLQRDYELAYLEDPFAEDDLDAWAELMRGTGDETVIGDNFYSTDAGRIRRGAEAGHANAAIIKPNQAGTVTAALDAIDACRETNQAVITSHRSVSTESTFLSWLTVACAVELIKIGPLATDYSSVVRLNDMLRRCEEWQRA